MRRTSATAVLLLFGLLFGLTVALGTAGSAAAAGSQGASTTTLDEIQKCLGNAPINGVPPSCTFDQNGNLIGRSSSGPGAGGSSVNLAPFLLLAVLWSAVPLVIAISVAQSRNEPVGLAVLLTVFLGWIGLLIVLYGQRRTVDDVGRLVHASPSPATPTPAPPGPAAAATPAERLGTLDGLYAQGLITADERDRRRAAILDEV